MFLKKTSIFLISICIFYIFQSPLSAQSVGLDRFCGLNNDSGAAISDCESQDNLNVETNITATALKKRRGFTREASLTITTSPVSGWAQHKCDSGDTLQVVCNDRNCAKSTNGGAFTVFHSTAGTSGMPARWSFVSVDGDLYGANDKRDAVFRYDCTALTNPSDIPAGSILAMTEDRMIVADPSANPNRVHYSKSGDFVTFTVGSATEDPFSDDLGAPGERTTGLAYNAGILFRWTPQSITACETGDQYTQRCSILSPNIGTNDPASIVVANGSVYFKGSDGGDWKIGADGSLDNISKKIKTLNRATVSGAARSNTQTTQEDWQNGTDNPDGTWDAATSAGSVFPSSVTLVDTSSTNFAAGTNDQSTTTFVPGLVFAATTSSYPFINADFEVGDDTRWTYATSGPTSCGDNGVAATTATTIIQGAYAALLRTNACELVGEIGDCDPVQASQAPTLTVSILDGNNSVLIGPTSVTASTTTISLASLTTTYVKVKFLATRDASADFTASAVSDAFVRTTTSTVITFRRESASSSGGSCEVEPYLVYNDFFVDAVVSDGLYYSSSVFTSRIFDTGFSTTVGGPFNSTFTATQGMSFYLRSSTASDNSGWTSFAATSDTLRSTQLKRYWQYRAIAHNPGSNGVSYSTQTWQINEVSLKAATTGQFKTQCIEPGSGATSFGIIACDFTTAGAGSVSIAIATGTTCALTTDAVYTAATNNATITNGIGAAMKIRLTSLLGSATDQAQVNACTTYWNEGTVAQPVFGAFDSIANAIYWTATTTAATQGNRVKKYDLNLENSGVSPWFIFDLRATALGFFQNSMYFGSSTGGFWNKYGAEGINTDNGADINAYWKSRDFGGNDPFVEKDWKYISLIARNNVTGNFTTTYTDSFNKSSAYTVSLATTSSINYIRSTHSMFKRSPSNFLNVQIGNNSATPFEVLGLRLDFVPQPWRAGSNP